MRHELSDDHPSVTLEILLVVIVCGATLVLIAARNLREWQLERRSVSDIAELERLSTDLLEYVKRESLGARPVVELRPFWARQTALNAADRYAVQVPLQRAGVLLAADDHHAFWQKLWGRLSDWAFLPLPERVVLNARERELMVNVGASAASIVADCFKAHTTSSSTNIGGFQISPKRDH